MFNFGEFLSISNFEWRVLLNKAAIYGEQKDELLVLNRTKKIKYTFLVFNIKCIKSKI
jgi:hypothetical protein